MLYAPRQLLQSLSHATHIEETISIEESKYVVNHYYFVATF